MEMKDSKGLEGFKRGLRQDNWILCRSQKKKMK